MKNQIIDILTIMGIQDQFIIGDGANSPLSEVHYKIDPKKHKLDGIQYAIQFEKESKTIALWDIRKRIELSASLDLYVQSKHTTWSSIKRFYQYIVKIGNSYSRNEAEVILMPFSEFSSFLLFNKDFDFSFEKANEDFDNTDSQLVSFDGLGNEGRKIYYYGTRYERDPNLRKAAIELQGYCCSVCGFNFEDFYGSIGQKYIEVHHIKPLCLGKQTPDPTTDLIVICSNCHKMIHRNKNSILSPEELKFQIKERHQ